MKIIIVHFDLLPEDKNFEDITDEELLQLCEQDTEWELHSEYDSVEELSAYWNDDELFSTSYSFMRIIH